MMQQTCPENRRRGKVDRYGSKGRPTKSQRNKTKRKKIVEVINFKQKIENTVIEKRT